LLVSLFVVSFLWATNVSDVVKVLKVFPAAQRDFFLTQYNLGNLSLEQLENLKQIINISSIYSNKKLGVIYQQGKYIFRIFSPRASSVNLYLKKTLQSKAKIYALKKSEDGVWSITIPGNLEGYYYKYSIDGPTGAGECFNPKNLLTDPYAKAVTSHNGWDVVVNSQYRWRVPYFKAPQLKDLIIYELHVKDFSYHKSANVPEKYRGKFSGLIYRGSKGRVLNHLRELGVNAVELLPVFQFDNLAAPSGHINYWGYMTTNFMALEEKYCTDNNPVKGIDEFKKMVDVLHQNGIAVILDVVFNHTAEGNEKGPVYNFKGIDNKLYYRLTPSFFYWNGTGCGNEFKTESKMVRRYIIDTLKYWVKECHVDGFRFDLAAGIDKDTILQIAKQLPPRVYLIAEPWTADWNRRQWTKGDLKGTKWANWNDDFKNIVRKYIVGHDTRNNIMTVIAGSCFWWTKKPQESVNFVECHDNDTIADLYSHNVQLQKLAGFLVLTSQGVAMLHEGQDFMKDKNGNSNSYDQDNATNWINWNLKYKKENYDVFQFYRGLIAIRKKYPNFRRGRPLTDKLVKWIYAKNSNRAIGYVLKAQNSQEKDIVVLINPEGYKVQFILPKGEWKILCNGYQAGLDKKLGIATGDYWVDSKTGIILLHSK
jgi:pullulanase